MRKKHSINKAKEFERSIERIAAEIKMNLPELVGRFIAQCQIIETQIKLYLTKNGKTAASLEKRTLGQLYNMFKGMHSDPDLNGWLESVIEERNEAAHNYFVFDVWTRRKFGEMVHGLNRKAIRKDMRMAEICTGKLDKLISAKRVKSGKARDYR